MTQLIEGEGRGAVPMGSCLASYEDMPLDAVGQSPQAPSRQCPWMAL